MTIKTVQERIREYYTAQNGEWLVEKGKLKEAKLLKEACLKLEQWNKELEKLRWKDLDKMLELSKKERELTEREKKIVDREVRFEERKDSFIEHLKKWT